MKSVSVQTKYGILEGEERGNHCVFRGIPYARPPIGPLRFRAPEPPEPWTGTRSAHHFGPSALQGVSFAPGAEAEGEQSEDCLYLNVYTPAADGQRRPVMFWIHGGAFTLGSGSMPLYEGRHLVELGDVVLVTFNYRLGAFGYLYLGEHGRSWGAVPNAGMLDQIAALHWVNDNIKSFGGDPKNITVFGESAGGTSACDLLIAPAARGFYQRVIIQSGAVIDKIATAEDATTSTEILLTKLGISADQTDLLQEIPPEKILKAQAAVETKIDQWRGFFPVIDPDSLPLQPEEAFASGQTPKVPILTGTNRDEVNLFVLPSLPEIDLPLEQNFAVNFLKTRLPDATEPQLVNLMDTYRKSRQEHGLPHSNRALLYAINSDFLFRIPNIRFSEMARARDERIYRYLFCYESPSMKGLLRACHALELPFVFGTLDAPYQDRFAGQGAQVEMLSRTMMKTWIAFARNGDPNHPELDRWEHYDPDKRSTMIFDLTSRSEEAPFDRERQAWDGLL